MLTVHQKGAGLQREDAPGAESVLQGDARPGAYDDGTAKPGQRILRDHVARRLDDSDCWAAPAGAGEHIVSVTVFESHVAQIIVPACFPAVPWSVMSPTQNDRRDPAPASAIRAATTLAVWSAAVAGGASADAAIDAVTGIGMPRGVRAASVIPSADHSGQTSAWRLPGPGEPHAGHTELLAFVRQGGPAELLLPVPGDVRGLPPGGEITLPALDAGAVVVLPDHGVGLVPTDGHWRAYPCGPAHPVLAEHDARALVDNALRDATAALARADIARSSGSPRERLRQLILAEEVELPERTPSAASALLAQSIALHALIRVAFAHETAAVTARSIGAVDEALAPLAAAVRESRRTAVAMAVAALHPAVSQRDPAPGAWAAFRRSAG